MSPWLRRLGGALLALLLVGYAYVAVIPTGLTGGEYRTLVEIEEIVHPSDAIGLEERFHHLFDVHGTEGRPLSALSLAVSSLLWSPGVRGLAALRLENLLLLVFAAACTSVFVRRLLVPWLGSDQASAAGRASALLVLVQPLHISAVATLRARGDLLALFLCAASAALFLKSRQDRVYVLTGAAALLALLAGLCSRLALGLPLVLALAEYASSRRYRPSRVRWRTALSTLLVFTACVGFDLLVWNVQSGFSSGPVGAGGAGAPLGDRVAVSIERLGALLVPVNREGVGWIGFGVAGALLLMALQPALVAARSAPRLWGWLALGWVAITAVAEVFSPPVRVRPEDFTGAATLLSASTAACIGIGVSATALSGVRRVVLPIALALGWSVLAHYNGVAWSESARAVGGLRRDLLAAQETWGAGATMLVVDPPGRVAGVDSVSGALPWMLDPLFGGGDERPDARALTAGALRVLGREPEFAALRAEPLVVVFPVGLLGMEGTGRESTRLDPYVATPGRKGWFNQGDSGQLDRETLEIGALVVTGSAGSETSQPPIVAWRSNHVRLEALREPRLEGVWTAVDDPPTAVFDLSSSPAWLLGGRVQQLWSERGWIRMHEAELRPALPTVEGEWVPRVEGADWYFDAAPGTFAGAWFVELLDLRTWEHVELAAERTEGGSLRVRGAGAWVQEWLRADSHAVAWSLEERRDGHAVRRVGGRREPN